MKRIILTSAMFLISIISFAQLNSSNWCIQNMTSLIDTNGKPYMLVELSNHEPFLDSMMYMVAIEEISTTSGIVHAKNYQYMNFEWTTSDTSIMYKVDTAVAMNTITGFVIRLGMQGCGMFLMDSVLVNTICDRQTPLSVTNSTAKDTKVFPNPTKDVLSVELNTSKKQWVILRNAHGQIVFKKETNTGFQKINIPTLALPKGMYLLSIGKNETHKVVIQ